MDKCCYFCNELDYDLLDVHRIKPGKDGGIYCEENTITVCSCCHRKCHSGRINIIGKYYTTAGRYVIKYVEDGLEKMK